MNELLTMFVNILTNFDNILTDFDKFLTDFDNILTNFDNFLTSCILSDLSRKSLVTIQLLKYLTLMCDFNMYSRLE